MPAKSQDYPAKDFGRPLVGVIAQRELTPCLGSEISGHAELGYKNLLLVKIIVDDKPTPPFSSHLLSLNSMALTPAG